MLNRNFLKRCWPLVSVTTLFSTASIADEFMSGEFVRLDREKPCVQIDDECHEIAARQQNTIIRQASRLDEGTFVLVRLQEGKVVEFGEIGLQSQPN